MAMQTRRKSDDSFKPESLQFGLRSLMWFMLAASIYFSQLSVFPRLRRGDPPYIAVIVLTVVGAWIALLVFYRHWRLKGAIVAHCFTPGFVLAIGILLILCTVNTRGIAGLAGMLVACCYVANLCSFPAAVLMLLVRGFEKAHEQRQRPNA